MSIMYAWGAKLLTPYNNITYPRPNSEDVSFLKECRGRKKRTLDLFPPCVGHSTSCDVL